MSAFYKAVLVRTLKGLIISGRAPNGADGGNGDGGWSFFYNLGCVRGVRQLTTKLSIE